jgi:DNA modification methylase
MPGRDPTSKRKSYECDRCGAATRGTKGTTRVAQRLCTTCFGKRTDKRPRELNELSGKEWASKSKSISEYPDVRSEKQKYHGASFPRSLAKEQIEIYTRLGQTVVDPFVGVGTTLDACHELGRRGIGVDINEEFLALAKEDLINAGATGESQVLLHGDARELSSVVGAEVADLIMTSPPYGSLLRNIKGAFAYKWQEHSQVRSVANARPYSEKAGDLGNLEYSEFLDAIETCLHQTYKVMKPDAYAVWIVKDFRAHKEGVPYVNYHGHFIDRAEAAGLTLWDLRVWDQTRHRPLVCLGYPSRNYYLNLGHSYVVVLRKR